MATSLQGKVLVVVEHAGGRLNAATARTLAAAKRIGPATAVVFAADATPIAAAVAALDGVAEVVTVTDPGHAQPLAARIAPQLAELSQGASHVLAPSTTFGKDLLPRVAALAGCPQVSDLMEVVDARTFKRPIYAGNVITTVRVPVGVTVFATVRTASFKEVGSRAGGSEAAPVRAATPTAALPTHTRFVGLESARSDRPDLQSAARVVSGGRGVGSAEHFAIVYRLADLLGAAVGASRAAVDAGYVPNDLQVGQTGKIIAPDLYIAVGISGAIQHLTGIKDAGTIVAINKDGDAPIFEVADLGLVGDLFAVLPELERALLDRARDAPR
jgi:electron transfer flavoprotein alpha subunit